LQAIEKLAGNIDPGKLIVLEYHIRDQYATGETMAWFMNFANQGTPSVYFNGENPVLGGGDTSPLYSMYLSRVNAELTINSTVSMTGTLSPADNQVKLILTNKSSSAINGAQLVGVAYTDLGTTEHHFVVRDITTSKMNLAAGGTGQYSVSLEVPGSIVVFLKDASGSILQSLAFT
jgi:hypothetical protein